MPRERIQHGNLESDGWTWPSLDVEWQRDAAHVQVAIEFDRDRWATIAKELAEDKAVSHKAIYTSSLSRPEINNMIRTLRRARDAAYGGDE